MGTIRTNAQVHRPPIAIVVCFYGSFLWLGESATFLDSFELPRCLADHYP